MPTEPQPTPEQVKAYVTSGGARCLFCGSSDIEAGSFDYDIQPGCVVECTTCKRSWTEVYTLTDVVVVEVDEHTSDDFPDEAEEDED